MSELHALNPETSEGIGQLFEKAFGRGLEHPSLEMGRDFDHANNTPLGVEPLPSSSLELIDPTP